MRAIPRLGRLGGVRLASACPTRLLTSELCRSPFLRLPWGSDDSEVSANGQVWDPSEPGSDGGHGALDRRWVFV
jgi:hypothetical protein